MPPRKKKVPAKGQDDQGWVFLGKAGGDRPAAPADDDIDISLAEIEEALKENPELLAQLKALAEKALEAFVEKHGRPPTEEEFLAEIGFDEDDEDGVENFLDGLFDDIDDDDLKPFPRNLVHGDDDEDDDEDDDDDEDEDEGDEDEGDTPAAGRGRGRGR